MKKYVYLITLLFWAFTSSGQERTISPDSILVLFQQYPPFEVLQKTGSDRFPSIKDLYYSKELKPYLLQLLSKDEYSKHVARQNIAYFATQENSIKEEIQIKLRQQNREHWLDSILASPVL